MIKNERQYRITKAQAASFADATKQLQDQHAGRLPDVLRKAQIDALKSQYDELLAEIEEYEALRREVPAVIETQSFEDLPRALIKARIALGMSQKELAEKMGLKEQQIQRYEATEFSSASLSRIIDVADALGVGISERVALPAAPTRKTLVERMDGVGIDADFLFEKLLPANISMGLGDEDVETQKHFAVKAAKVLGKVYNWSTDAVFGIGRLELPRHASGLARFKLPGGTHGRRLNAYIVYAHYIGMVVANACREPVSLLTLDPKEMREKLLARDENISLRCVIHHFWDSGVPVVPLSDSGAFHGASWRVNGRNVVVVKQRSRYLARWVFDLLHEWFHAAQDPGEPTHGWVEESEITSARRNSPEEKAANMFSGNVVLDGRAENLVKECTEAAGGKIPLLKSVVPRIAEQNGVIVDHLANYLAWRLSLQGVNWWGTANNLQTQVGDPFMVARDVFYERFDFRNIDPVDAQLLGRALATEGVVDD
jgi:transcriptional regulator with XRE-family HTH domain